MVCVVGMVLGFSGNSHAQNVIAFQGFEGSSNDNWNYSYSPSVYNSINSPAAYGPAQVWDRMYFFDGAFWAYSGSRMWSASDITPYQDHTLDFDPFPVTGLQNGTLSFRYLTYNLSSWDEIEYSVKFDNGNSWSSFVPLPLNTLTWQLVSIPIPSNADYVRLRIRQKQVNGIVCTGIDNVKVTGTFAAPEVTTGYISTQLCLGSASTPVNVPYTATGIYQPGNQFIAQLSDANGSFSNPVVIGSVNSSGNNPSGTINASIPANTPPGTGYRIRVMATNPTVTGAANTADITLSNLDFTLARFQYGSGRHISCPEAADGSITLTVNQGTPPYAFQWNGPGGYQSNAQNISGLAAGTYSVTVTDANGCTATQSTSLIGPALNITLNASNISCYGQNDGSISVNVNGTNPPFSLLWNGPNGFVSASPGLNALSAGTYDLTVTDAANCSVSRQVIIIEPTEITLDLSSPVSGCGHEISCQGANDGSIQTTITGGTLPYSLAWSGPNGWTSTTNNPSNLAPGTYDLTVTDSRGCMVSGSITLTEPPALSAAISAPVNGCGHHVTCNGGADGSIAVSNIAGGCPPYTLQWDHGPTSLQITGLTAGNYGVNVVDANNCSLRLIIQLTEPGPILPTVSLTHPLCEEDNNGAIDLTITGGCPPYTHAWSGPDGFSAMTEDLQNLYAGTYSVLITDAMGCSVTDSFTLTGSATPAASIACEGDTVICEGDSTLIRVDLIGTPPWSLVWSENGVPKVVTVNTSPYYISAAPATTTVYELLGVGNFCGEGDVCGVTTVAVEDCALEPGNPCLSNCFRSELLSAVDQNNCRTFTLRISSDGTCTRALSNMTISIPCGEYQAGSGSSSRGWPVLLTDANGDPNSGLVGIKVDNINFGGGSAPDTFTVTYTICDPQGCGLPDGPPLVAFKAGNCLDYQVTSLPGGALRPQPKLTLYPNPSQGPVSLLLQSEVSGYGSVRIIDLKSIKEVHRSDLGWLEAGTHKYTWQGRKSNGMPVPAGIYLVEMTVGETRRVSKLVVY